MESLLRQLLRELPALLLVGPRATGKTTTALRFASTVVRLDHQAEAEAFSADPDAALRGLEEPVLFDEWQAVPEILGSIKRAVDSDPRPGRYLLTGSVRAELDAPTWPGTGRLVRVPMYGMTIKEQLGRTGGSAFIDRLATGERQLQTPPDSPDLRGYVELALSSGFPEAALGLSGDTRIRWLSSYVDQLISRDAPQLEPARDPARLRRYLEAFSLNSAATARDTTLFEAAGINRRTADAYDHLLTNLLVIEALPAWTSNRLKRLVLSSRRYLIDAALFSGVLGLDAQTVLRDGDLLGRVLDTFVVSQFRSELPLARARPRLYHLRTREGRHEIDLIAELPGSGILAIEIKAEAAPKRDAARHIVWLRDQLGDRFVAGVVLHTGPRSFEMDERIVAVPICALWA